MDVVRLEHGRKAPEKASIVRLFPLSDDKVGYVSIMVSQRGSYADHTLVDTTNKESYDFLRGSGAAAEASAERIGVETLFIETDDA